MRPWVEKVYGVRPEQLIGSRFQLKYELPEGKPVLLRLPELDFIDDKAGKPIGIQKQIGRRLIMAFGNADGDFEMLEYTTAGIGLRFGLIVHDAQCEMAYERKSRFGKLDKAFDHAPKQGWVVVDMAKDWKTVFPPQK